MLLRGGPSLNAEEKAALALFRALSTEQRQMVADFMVFLAARAAPRAAPKATEPVLIPRPEQESVVKAIKRLRASYPMLDQNKLLNDTSQQMTAHLIHGKPAAKVIDELEIVFSRFYRLYREEREDGEGEPPSPPDPPQSASEA